MIIYIRHGEDEEKDYKYDESLTHYGKKSSRKLAHKLIDQYGIPDAIYYSPFYRTRQTLREMLIAIDEHTDQRIEKVCDPRLSRFFTKQQKRNPDIRSDTKRRGPPLDEEWEEFKLRVKDQIEEIENEEGIVWCITHTLVLSRVIKIKGLDHGYKIPYLDTIVLN